jgi:hypothetical protein
MSYEGDMLVKLAMPARREVENAIITTLFKHNGSIKEFSASEEIVSEIAGLFSLTQEQREAVLERIYRKENRIVKTPLWHRLLFRAADTLAKEKLVTRPTDTAALTDKREWLLTEKGVDYALQLLKIPSAKKEILPIKSFEVQKEANKIKDAKRPLEYIPFEENRKVIIYNRKNNIRTRGFRQAVIEIYDYRCCVCGLKVNSPDMLSWEVEAAHIVPHGINGKDDVWNGISLCRLHHWAFDAGWFSFTNNYKIIASSALQSLPAGFGRIGSYDLFRDTIGSNKTMLLPDNDSMFPHEAAIEWHRNNVLHP